MHQNILYKLIGGSYPLKHNRDIKDILTKLEKELQSDILVYHGIMDKRLMEILSNAIKYNETNKKDKRDRLTIVLNSKGGIYPSVIEFIEKFYASKIYKELWVIINGNACSAAAFFSLFADRLYVFPVLSFGESYFSRIDPQYPVTESTFASVFHLLELNKIEYKPLTIDFIKNSKGFIVSDNWQENEEIKEWCYLLNKITFMAFNALMKHNFQGKATEQDAVNIINKLMLGTVDGSFLYRHNELIHSNIIIDLKLQVEYIEDKSLLKRNLKSYNESMCEYLAPDCENNIEKWGNYLNCYIQTRDTITI